MTSKYSHLHLHCAPDHATTIYRLAVPALNADPARRTHKLDDGPKAWSQALQRRSSLQCLESSGMAIQGPGVARVGRVTGSHGSRCAKHVRPGRVPARILRSGIRVVVGGTSTVSGQGGAAGRSRMFRTWIQRCAQYATRTLAYSAKVAAMHRVTKDGSEEAGNAPAALPPRAAIGGHAAVAVHYFSRS